MYRFQSSRHAHVSYEVDVRAGKFRCNCPAGHYKGHCFHVDAAKGLTHIAANITDVPHYDAIVMAARTSGDWRKVDKYRELQIKELDRGDA
jgi:hypothetical protein